MFLITLFFIGEGTTKFEPNLSTFNLDSAGEQFLYEIGIFNLILIFVFH